MVTTKARRAVAVGVGKVVRTGVRRLGRGGGTTLPGFLAQRIDPGVVSGLIRSIPGGFVAVSGTNGKTTTSRMLAVILRADGRVPIHNHEGSNMAQGLATTLLAHTDALGRLNTGDRAVGLLELDEGALAQLLPDVQPRVLLLTNIFRDQLDRYFEIDYLMVLWRRAFAHLPSDTVLVLNADDPLIASLGTEFSQPVVYYGLEDASWGHPGLEHASDTRRCPRCHTNLQYSCSFYAHLGHYRCPGCGFTRPEPHVRLVRLALNGVESSHVDLELPSGAVSFAVPFPGLYNAYNVLAACATAEAAGIHPDHFGPAIATVRAAFGRLERFELDGHPVYLVLVKNPIGFNEVLRMLRSAAGPTNLLLALNDNPPDGRDVSWIWDVDFEALRGNVRLAVTSGLRAHDLALRLKHAEWFLPASDREAADYVIQPDVIHALDVALRRTPASEPLYVLSTYTVLWELREDLRRRGIVQPLWS